MKRTPEGSEIEPETLCLQAMGAQVTMYFFVERANELWYAARLRCWSTGAVGKPSLNRAISCML